MKKILLILLALALALLIWGIVAPDTSPLRFLNADVRREHSLEKCKKDEECNKMLGQYNWHCFDNDMSFQASCDEASEYLEKRGVMLLEL